MRAGGRRADELGAATAHSLGERDLKDAALKSVVLADTVRPEWTLTQNDLTFTVRESTRRKTVSLGLERDGQLLILAPAGTPKVQLERLVTARQDWLYRQLAEKERVHRPARAREYVTGEGFWYAGRSYRLRVEPDSPDNTALELRAGRFRLGQAQVHRGRELFTHWYAAHLLGWAEEQRTRISPRMHAQSARLRVADLGHRWGSCSTGGDVTLHWRVALLPRRMAEYVLVHELVHLEHHHHRPAFWERLGVLLPDHAERRAWLALHGADYDL